MFLIWLLPPLRVFWLIHRYAVNIPFGDDFDPAMFLNRVHDHGVRWADLIAQHNESRFLTLRLLTLGLTCIHHQLDLRLLMLASLMTVLLTAALILRLIQRTFGNSILAWLAAVLANLLLFLPSQWMNFLWGVQWIVFVPAATLVAGLVLLDEKASLRWGLPISMFAALIASYTNSNGFLIWALLLPAVWWRSRRFSAAWIFAAALSVGYFFHGYDRSNVPSHLIDHPLASAWFLLAFLGNALRCTENPNTAAVIGLIAVAMFAMAVLILCLACDRETIRKSGPWMVLAAYSILSGILATAGRFSLGLPAAIPPRYSTFAIPFFIALMLVWILLATAMPGKKSVISTTGVVAMMVLLSFESARFIGGEMKRYHAARLSALAMVHWSRLATDDRSAAIALFPSPRDAYFTIFALQRNDIFPADLFFQSGELKTVLNEKAGPAIGAMNPVEIAGDRLKFSGWALLPDTHRSADLVLITARGPDGEDRLIAVTGDVRRRHVVDGKPADVGWMANVESIEVDASATVRAWAYDATSRRARVLR